MPDLAYLSLSGAKVNADAAQARMAASVMRLFRQGFTPTPTSTKEDFEAWEADFDGYAAATIATWAAAILAGTGWITYSPTQTFAWVFDTDSVGNSIGGYWLQTAGGVLIGYATFDPAKPAQGPGQAVVCTASLVFPAG